MSVSFKASYRKKTRRMTKVTKMGPELLEKGFLRVDAQENNTKFGVL